MKAIDPIVCLELHIIQKIIDDETWLEGERRGCRVNPNDPAVRAKVCEIVMRIGAQLRLNLQAAHDAGSQPMRQVHAMAA